MIASITSPGALNNGYQRLESESARHPEVALKGKLKSNAITEYGKILASGNITINNFDIEKEPVNAKENMGLVPDSPDLFASFDVSKYFDFMIEMYNVDKKLGKERVEKLVKEFEIEKYLNDSISDLSHGTRQKVMIIGVLLHNPSVWILDEPMTGLDPKASHILKEKMREHAKNGNTVFFSTHVLEVAEKLCTKIIIISEGSIKYTGKLEELQAMYPEVKTLEELFFKVIDNSKEA